MPPDDFSEISTIDENKNQKDAKLLDTFITERKEKTNSNEVQKALSEFAQFLKSPEFDKADADWHAEFDQKKKSPEFTQTWTEFLHEKAREWIRTEIERREKAIEDLKKDLATIPGALHMSPLIAEKLKEKDGWLVKVIQQNLDELKARRERNEEINLSTLSYSEDLTEEERKIVYDLTKAIYTVDSSGKKAGMKEGEDRSVISDWYRERTEPVNSNKIIAFEKALEEEGKKFFGTEEEAMAFKHRIIFHYVSNAGQQKKLEDQITDLKLTERVHGLGAKRFEQFWSASRTKDGGAALQKFFEENKGELGDDVQKYAEKKKAIVSDLKNIEETLNESKPIIIADLQKKVEKMALPEEEKKTLYSFLDTDIRSARTLIELQEENPESGREILDIMQISPTDVSFDMRKEQEKYRIFVDSKLSGTRMELSLYDQEEGGGLEGLKVVKFSTALSPFPVTAKNFRDTHQYHSLVTLLEPHLLHTMQEIVKWRPGDAQIPRQETFAILRKMIRNHERPDDMTDNEPVEMTQLTYKHIEDMGGEIAEEKDKKQPMTEEDYKKIEKGIFTQYFPGIVSPAKLY